MLTVYDQQPVQDPNADAGEEHQPDADAATEAERPAVATARAMIAAGEATPDAMGRLLTANIYDRDAILAVLHEAMGNAFVEQVMDAVYNREPEAKPPIPEGQRGPGSEAVWTAMTMDMAPSAALALLIRYPDEWDEMRKIVLEQKGEAYLAELMDAYDTKRAELDYLMDAGDGGPSADTEGEGAEAAEAEVEEVPEPEAVETSAPEEIAEMTADETAADTAHEPVEAEPDVEAVPENPIVAEAIEQVDNPEQEQAQEPESEWVVKARAYNAEHATEVASFDDATGGSCRGKDGELDPRAVSRWQDENGVSPDGRVGPRTVAAAKRAPKTAEATPEGEAGPVADVQQLLAEVNSWGSLFEPIVCSDEEFEQRVDGYVTLVELWRAYYARYTDLRAQLAACGQSDIPELRALSDAIGVIPHFVTVQTDTVNATLSWTSVGSMRAELIGAFEAARAAAA